jgi:hypothetical protein
LALESVGLTLNPAPKAFLSCHSERKLNERVSNRVPPGYAAIRAPAQAFCCLPLSVLYAKEQFRRPVGIF